MRSEKKLIALLLVLALCLSLAACAKKTEDKTEPAPTAEPTAEPTALPLAEPAAPAGVAAALGDYTVTVKDVEEDYNYFVSYMGYYGMEAPTAPTDIAEYVEMIVDSKIGDLALAWQADLQGMTLTPEMEADVEAKVQEQKEGIEASYRDTAVEELGEGAAEEQIAQKAKELLDADVMAYMNCDFDSYLEDFRKSLIVSAKGELLEKTVKAGVSIAETEPAEWFTSAAAADKEAVDADPFAYREKQKDYEKHLSDVPALYAPAGFVRAQIIKIAMDEESAATFEANAQKMKELEAEYGAEALKAGDVLRRVAIRNEYNGLVAANKELADAVKALAETVHQEALTSNMAFAVLSRKYDKSLDEEAAENGSLVYVNGEDAENSPVLTAAVAALGDGDISGILEIDGAYYIVRRVGAIAEGAVSFENVKAVAEAQALLAKQESVWSETLNGYNAAAAAAAVKYPANYAQVGLAQ